MKYSDEYPDKIRHVVSENKSFGATGNELARLFGVSRSTITEWRNKYPDFNSAVIDARDTVDDFIESELLRNAMGGKYTETREIFDESGMLIKKETLHKVKFGDVQAQRMWLMNRRPDEWRDKQFELNLTNKVIVKAEDLTDDELARIACRSGE